MNRPSGRSAPERPPGVIDTLSAGYETVNRRLWILLFPIGLDLLFWLGPKLSIVRVAGYLPYSTLQAEEFSGLTELLSRFNLIVLLALYIPTVLGRVPFSPPDLSGGVTHTIYHVTPGTLLLALLALVPVGLLAAAFYLGAIGQLVREDRGRGPLIRFGVRSWARLLALHGVAGAALALLIVPWLLTALLALWVDSEVLAFLRLLLQVGLLWLGFSFFFTMDAVIVTDASPLRAALSSVRVVRESFGQAALLIALVLVISTGLPIVWRAMSTQPLGLLASILGNAYIGTGIVAATMLFYRDRVALITAPQSVNRA